MESRDFKQLHPVQIPPFRVYTTTALYRLSVETEVPSQGSIFKKRSVCLYKFGMILSKKNVFYNILKIQCVESVYFFNKYLLASETMAISCYHDSLTVLIRLVYATQIFKK